MLSRRDEEIVKAINFYRYMTALDVAHLLFSPSSLAYVRKQLTALAGGSDNQPNQYLYRFGLPKATKGNVERIYTLGSRGRDFLVNSAGLSVNWYFQPGRTATHNYSFLVHSLAVTHVLVAASYWSRRQEAYRLINTRISYELANTPGREANAVIPDGWLQFERSDGHHGAVVIEIDRGTEYQERFKRHVASRLEFVRGGAYKEMFGGRTPLICYISIGERLYRVTRRATMMAWAEEVIKELELEQWGAMFRFADVGLEKIYTADLFDKLLWYAPFKRDAGSLFGD